MLGWFLEQLIKTIGPIAQISQERRKLVDAALGAVSEALTETYLYCQKSEMTGRDPVVEANLSRRWAAAVVPLRHVSEDLAAICEAKSQYWIDPDQWRENGELEIGLDHVRSLYQQVALPKVFGDKGRQAH
jgi:hypothetical protein